jgi:tripartite-type tricarboxylate transporter receptor subunit TctC
MTDLLAEPVDLMVSQAAVGLPNLQAGTIKPIANLSPRRSQAVPEIPSSDESGVPGLYAEQQRPEGLAALHKAEIENVADPQVSQHQNRLGRVQQSFSWRVKRRSTLHRREQRLRPTPSVLRDYRGIFWRPARHAKGGRNHEHWQ